MKGCEPIHPREKTIGAYFHPVRSGKFDIYICPVVGYTVWGDMDLEMGGIGAMASDVGFGGTAGVDVSFGKSKWAFSASVRYLSSTTGDDTLQIPVDPMYFTLGFARSF